MVLISSTVRQLSFSRGRQIPEIALDLHANSSDDTKILQAFGTSDSRDSICQTSP